MYCTMFLAECRKEEGDLDLDKQQVFENCCSRHQGFLSSLQLYSHLSLFLSISLSLISRPYFCRRKSYAVSVSLCLTCLAEQLSCREKNPLLMEREILRMFTLHLVHFDITLKCLRQEKEFRKLYVMSF